MANIDECSLENKTKFVVLARSFIKRPTKWNDDIVDRIELEKSHCLSVMFMKDFIAFTCQIEFQLITKNVKFVAVFYFNMLPSIYLRCATLLLFTDTRLRILRISLPRFTSLHHQAIVSVI